MVAMLHEPKRICALLSEPEGYWSLSKELASIETMAPMPIKGYPIVEDVFPSDQWPLRGRVLLGTHALHSKHIKLLSHMMVGMTKHSEMSARLSESRRQKSRKSQTPKYHVVSLRWFHPRLDSTTSTPEAHSGLPKNKNRGRDWSKILFHWYWNHFSVIRSLESTTSARPPC